MIDIVIVIIIYQNLVLIIQDLKYIRIYECLKTKILKVCSGLEVI